MTGDRMRMLLVDDDEGDILICQEALKKLPFVHDIAVVRDGRKALDYLHKRPPHQKAHKPDLILLDINMPGMTGIEVLKHIKSDASLKTIPVCMLTTSDAVQDVVSSYASHANCYITKPVQLDQFLDAVRQVTNFWTKIATLPSQPNVDQKR